MSISTLGWGAGALVTSGFGTTGRPEIPQILAEGVGNLYAYTCVLSRTYTELQSRSKDEIAQREKTEILKRSTGWPWQSDPCLEDS